MLRHRPSIYAILRISGEDADTVKKRDQAVLAYAHRRLRADVKKVFRELAPTQVPPEGRPEMMKLLDGIRAGDRVVAERLDDVCASADGFVRLVDDLRRKGVELHLVGFGDVTRKGPLADFAACFADLDRMRRGERTRAGQAVRRAQGKRVGGAVAFGWTLASDGTLVENPEQQKVIERMRELRAQGKSFRDVAAALRLESGLTLSPFGIQKIVENKRKADAFRKNRHEGLGFLELPEPGEER